MLRQDWELGSPRTVSVHNPTAVYLWGENKGLKNNETSSLSLTLDYKNDNFPWSEKTSCYFSNTGCVDMYV